MKLAARPGLFLVGEIRSGTIRAGMVVRVADDHVGVVPIVGVESVDYGGGKSHVALHLAFDDPANEMVEALWPDGSTVEVVEPS
jgi:hypothetical protein